jgi:hypothetical protein
VGDGQRNDQRGAAILAGVFVVVVASVVAHQAGRSSLPEPAPPRSLRSSPAVVSMRADLPPEPADDSCGVEP